MSVATGRVVVLLAVAVTVFAGVSIAGDLDALGTRLVGYAWSTFVLAVVLSLTNYALRFVRWQGYLRRQDVRVPRATSALVFVAGFAMAVTPGKVGELVKSYLLRQSHGVPIAATAPIVLAERVTDLSALLVLGLGGFLAYGAAGSLVLGGAVVVGAGFLVLAWPPLARRLVALVTAPGPLRRFRAPLEEVHRGVAGMLRAGPLASATSIAVVAWLAECVGFAAIASGFEGAAIPIGLAILVYATGTLAGALSFLPGGLIVTEGSMVLLLVQGTHRVDEGAAVAIVFLTRLATLWLAVGLGAVALACFRRRHR
jgi:uncharacterized membrane protein YbhN (UPF0104 family)